MITNYRIASAAAGIGRVSLALEAAYKPQDATRLSRALLLLRELRRARRRPPGGGGGPAEEHPTRRIMSDPHFWMLMIH